MSDSDGSDGGGEPNIGEGEPYYPYVLPYRNTAMVPHYYGDYVRSIFIVVGAFMLILAPFVSERAPQLLPIQVVSAVVLVLLAGLTSPKKEWVLILDAIAAGLGVIFFEFLALAAYNASAWFSFIALEIVTISFLVALYFSIKTVRAMSSGQIGKKPSFGEFNQQP